MSTHQTDKSKHQMIMPMEELVERFRTALMVEHHNDWDMDTISEAAHICARAVLDQAVPVEQMDGPEGDFVYVPVEVQP
jgi:hypothetical protein